jgi:hypothetical protein
MSPSNSYNPVDGGAIARLRQQGKVSDGPYTYRGIPSKMGNMLMSGIEPPVKKRFKTSKKVFPGAHHDRDALAVPFFSMRLGQSFPFEIAHARRHLWQARQVREHAEFPS